MAFKLLLYIKFWVMVKVWGCWIW